ncbi:unnamed protein product [Paramecium pentaurelia]|uniref:RCK N-terminal domain-containing protein n=1 Tax=Paramecium pentaurelia TaxID=43138 RepID=A0A8S1TYF0_9CILI|nr:unnamed protein product [Paramecium pentaurelia]
MSDDEEKEFKHKQRQTKQQLYQFIQRDEFNLIIDCINMSISFILIFVYIYSTYEPKPFQNATWAVFNTILHLLLLSEWIFKLYATKNFQSFIMSSESIIAILSLFPYFIIKISTLKLFIEDDDKINMFANLVCLFRGLEFDRMKKYLDSEVNKQLTSIMITTATLVLCAAGALHFNSLFLETVLHFKFHYFIYFVMTTISTMGYENKFSSAISRVLIIILVLLALTFVPYQTGQLIRHLSSKSYYARLNYKSSQAVPHIVILGTISLNAAENFFKELFHEDHGLAQKHAIILCPQRPDVNLESLIQQPEYSNVIYIQGDPHLDKDLKRCQIEKAKAIIIMCNKQSSDPTAEDSKTILLAIVIKSYLKQHNTTGVKIRFCMQILRQEGKTHYFLSLNKQTKFDQVICIEELKMSLLAKSCLCPGLIAFISNLITSSGNPPNLPQKWLNEYWIGQGFEIYKTLLPNFFRGKSFTQTVLILYKQFQVILFGIEISSPNDYEKNLLNPGDIILPSNPNYRVMGYIICKDKETADEISIYKQSHQDKMNQIKSDGTTRRLLESEETVNIRPRRPTIFQNVKTLFGFSQAEPDQKKGNTGKNENSKNVILHLKNQRGWVKTDMFDPSQDTLIHPKENEKFDQLEEIEENSDDQQKDIAEMQIKEKFQKDTARNWLQLDFNNNKIEKTSHLTNEKVGLKDVTFKTLQDSILAQNHVILCGLVANLINFILPLRSKYLITYPPIVILNDQEPSEKQWAQICYFPEIYFVKGTAMSQRDLIRANIEQAIRVVILSPKEISTAKFEDDSQENDQIVQQQQLTKDQEDLLDAKTIFKYRNIVRLKPHIQIVTEFVSPSNIQFLLFDKDYDLMKQYGYNHTPLFASGQIYFSSVMDGLLCQSFYNPALVQVLYQLLVGNIKENEKTGAMLQYQSKGMSQSKDFTSEDKDISSNLFQIPVPKAFQNKPFQKLFYHLVKMKQIVPLGLYRLAGATDNKVPYICTNPEPNTILTNKDIVLVLAKEMPQSDSINWGGPLEEMIQQQKQAHNIYKKKESTSSSEDNDLIQINDNNDKEVQRAKQYNNETEQVMKKIQNVIEDVSKLEKESLDFQNKMRERQDRILARLRDVFKEELLQFQQKRAEVSQNFTYKSSDD